MTLTDEELWSWSQGRAIGKITPRDVELAWDVAHLLPLLYVIPRYVERHPEDKTVFLEIGTADGSSALPMLRAAAEVGGHLHSVDPDRCEDAHRLVATFGYESYWTHHQTYSDEFFKTFRETIDFSFIDGDHRWPVIERDILNCYERTRTGGIVWVSDLNPLRMPYTPYEQEYDGPEFTPHASGTIHEAQSSCGVSKALLRAWPKLRGATAINLPLKCNPSAVIRKPHDHELLGDVARWRSPGE